MTPRRAARRSALALVAILGAGCGGAAAPVAQTPSTVPATSDGAPTSTAQDGTDPRQLLASVPPLHPSVDGYEHAFVDLVDPNGRVAWVLPVLVAQTPSERSHGLMEVTDLPTGTGMVFVFEADSTSGFWMKNTLVPLDIAYVDDGEVVSTTSMVPCPPDEPCPSYPADGPYDVALEVPAGFLAEVGLTADWQVLLRRG